MIADRFGVVDAEARMRFEKLFQVPFGYALVTFNYREAEEACKKFGKGHVVERITTNFNRINESDVIYRS